MYSPLRQKQGKEKMKSNIKKIVTQIIFKNELQQKRKRTKPKRATTKNDTNKHK